MSPCALDNGNVDRAPAKSATMSKRTVGGFGPTFCSPKYSIYGKFGASSDDSTTPWPTIRPPSRTVNVAPGLRAA